MKCKSRNLFAQFLKKFKNKKKKKTKTKTKTLRYLSIIGKRGQTVESQTAKN